MPGRYTLYARDHSTGERTDLSLRIKQSSRFEFQPGDDEARKLGLVVGIAGSVAFVAGIVLTLPVVMSSICEGLDCTTSTERYAATVGLGLLLGGAVLTPVGWTMFASNRTRLKRIDELPYASSETIDQVRVGVVGVGGVGSASAA